MRWILDEDYSDYLESKKLKQELANKNPEDQFLIELTNLTRKYYALGFVLTYNNGCLEIRKQLIKQTRFLEPNNLDNKPNLQNAGPPCVKCGGLTVPNGSCYKCVNCGETSSCS